MKRIFTIFLLFLYAAAVLGVTITRFYCCGEVRSVSLKWLERAKDEHSCNKEGCCKQKQQFVKVQDSHEGSAIRFVSSASHDLLRPSYVESASNLDDSYFKNERSLPHGPPLRNNHSLYLFFCNYRI